MLCTAVERNYFTQLLEYHALVYSKKSHLDSYNTSQTEKRMSITWFVAFVDLKKAFDSIARGSLWKFLPGIGIRLPSKLFNISFSSSRIRSDPFLRSSGFRQSSIAAPNLFNIAVDYGMQLSAAAHDSKHSWDRGFLPPQGYRLQRTIFFVEWRGCTEPVPGLWTNTDVHIEINF